LVAHWEIDAITGRPVYRWEIEPQRPEEHLIVDDATSRIMLLRLQAPPLTRCDSWCVSSRSQQAMPRRYGAITGWLRNPQYDVAGRHWQQRCRDGSIEWNPGRFVRGRPTDIAAPTELRCGGAERGL
jgi:hypothetical protein